MCSLFRETGGHEELPWYAEGELTRESMFRRFAPEEGKHRYTIVIDDQPMGYIQTYPVGDEPDYQQQVAIHPNAVAIDLINGEVPQERGMGH